MCVSTREMLGCVWTAREMLGGGGCLHVRRWDVCVRTAGVGRLQGERESGPTTPEVIDCPMRYISSVITGLWAAVSVRFVSISCCSLGPSPDAVSIRLAAHGPSGSSQNSKHWFTSSRLQSLP